MFDPERLVGEFVHNREVGESLDELGGPRYDRYAELEIREYADAGVAVYIDRTRRVVSVFLYGVPQDDHASYTGPMPRQMSFAQTRTDVRERLGDPSMSGTVKDTSAPWDRFDFERVCIHVQYVPDSRGIQMITLMSPEVARGEL